MLPFTVTGCYSEQVAQKSGSRTEPNRPQQKGCIVSFLDLKRQRGCDFLVALLQEEKQLFGLPV